MTGVSSLVTRHSIENHAKVLCCFASSASITHGSYNLEKVLNFSSRLEKSLNSVKVLEKYLISLLGLKKSLKFPNLSIPYHFSEKLNDFGG